MTSLSTYNFFVMILNSSDCTRNTSINKQIG